MLIEETEHTETGEVHVTAGRQPFLIVLESPVPGEPGRIVPIESRITIGRAGAQVIVRDAMLSKRHAEIVYAGGRCRIRDLDSRNGTRVNGVAVDAMELGSGDQIRIGATLLLYQDGAATNTHRSVLGTLGDAGVALWECPAGSADLVFSEHADAALELARSTLGHRRLPLARCIHADDLERFELALGSAREGFPLELEVRVQVANVERWVALRGKRSSTGAIAGTIVNITFAKRREATLTRTALMFEGFSDGVVLTDDKSAIVDLNTTAARMFGVAKREATSRMVFAVVPVLDAARRLVEIRDGVERSGRWSGTVCVPAGPDQMFELQVFPLLTDRGESAGIAWVFRDVTERARLEGRLAFLDRLASLGTMSAGVAHEINNPLTFVLTNAQVVREELSRGGLPELLEPIDEIIEGAKRIGKIVRDLKTFARADATAEPTATDVRGAVELAIKMSRSIAGSHVEITTAYEMTGHASAVESHLVQVLVNLIANAVQSYPEDRATPVVAVRVSDDAGGLAIEVSDTGCGMSPEVAARAFDPFFTTRPLRGGTGLGLSICHGLVTQMAGAISLRSLAGAGTTARVWLRKASAPRPRLEGPAPVAPRMRILLVDDEPLLLRAVKRMLADHDVTTADCFTAATKILFQDRASFDAILCDLMMPDGTGMELHARMVAERAELVHRLVFFTGAAFTEEAQRFLDTVANPQLFKPVDRATLRRVLFEVAK